VGLEYFKAKWSKGFHMVHYWNRLKQAPNWKICYKDYKEALKNGTDTVLSMAKTMPLARMRFHLVPGAKNPPRSILPAKIQPLP
jgi:hypothetical protein